MSHLAETEIRSEKKFSRRALLKRIGLLSTTALVAQYGLNELWAGDLTRSGRSISRTTGAPRHPMPTTCLMCPARCGVIGYLEDNLLVKIEGNPKDPNSHGRICAKGLAGIQYLYNPDRILVPLKRIGARGENKWKQISWDEALTEVADRLAKIRQNRPEGFIFMGYEMDLFTRRFLKALSTDTGAPTVFDGRVSERGNQEMASQLMWGAKTYVADLAHTKYILNFGANPYETHDSYVPLISRLMDGRLSGAKLVTFDPRLSNTAGKSDDWFPVKPGTDAVIALAMANMIVQLALYDRDFVEKWVNYPLDDLAKHLRPYTPELAESISGLKASHLRRIAIEFATTHPAAILTGEGVTQHRNGVQNERAIMLLAALTGNIDVRGGVCLPRFFSFAEPEPIPEYSSTLELETPSIASLFQKKDVKTELVMISGYNPAFVHANTPLIRNILSNEQLTPFSVVIDSYLTESAMLADLFLPAATYLESWGLHSTPAYGMIPYVTLQQPVVKPLGESKPINEIYVELAKRIGGGMEQYFQLASIETFLNGFITEIKGLQAAGGVEHLKDNGIWVDSSRSARYRTYETEGFNTPSAKFEIYHATLQKKGQTTLPTYVPIPDHQKLGEQFILITFQSNLQVGNRMANCMWLSEIRHDNHLWMNKSVAAARGIAQGDSVRVSSSQGSFLVRVHLTNGLDPRVVAIERSLGHWAYGRIAQAMKFKSDNPNTKLIWWDEYGNGVHPHSVIPIAADPIGGGQAWQDTTVTVTRVKENEAGERG